MRTAHAETVGEEKGIVQGGEDGDAKRGNYDWKRKGTGRHNAEEEGGCALCAGDKVERKQDETLAVAASCTTMEWMEGEMG